MIVLGNPVEYQQHNDVINITVVVGIPVFTGLGSL